MVAILRAYAAVLALIIGAVAFMAAPGSGGRGVLAQQIDADLNCTDPIVSISPCLSYMVRPSKPSIPEDDCCEALAAVITSHAACLCELYASNDFLGFPINQTLAMSLPSACNLLYPREIDQCTVVFPPISAGPVDQPGSNPPPPLLQAESPPPFDAVPPVNLPPARPRGGVPPRSTPSTNVHPNANSAAALFTPSLLRLFWGSFLTGILTVGYLG